MIYLKEQSQLTLTYFNMISNSQSKHLQLSKDKRTCQTISSIPQSATAVRAMPRGNQPYILYHIPYNPYILILISYIQAMLQFSVPIENSFCSYLLNEKERTNCGQSVSLSSTPSPLFLLSWDAARMRARLRQGCVAKN